MELNRICPKKRHPAPWALLTISIGLAFFVAAQLVTNFGAQLGFAALGIVSMVLSLSLVAES